MTTLQQVELGVLGPLRVRQYGLPVAIPGAKPRAILTMLGLHGGSVVSAQTLLELLWGDDPPRTAAKALQTHISSLRRALGDGFVLTSGGGWTLHTTEIDATRYLAAAGAGRDAAAAGDVNQAVARFDEALTLWRGVPELPDSPRANSERTRWIEDHAALVEDRADALLATGRAAEIIGELEAAIADAPLRERRWGQLMLALYRAGRQGEALGAYQRARSLLAEELGVDPGPDLRRLEASIVAQDPALELAVAQQLSSVTRAVTFLLTDIEGSTAAWEADAASMASALARHDEIIEQIVTSRGGRLVKTRGEGDATFSVFDRPSAAATAAIELQEAIQHEPWTLAVPMRVRVALHTGEVELRDGDYFGRAVNRAARLRSLAAGGQILCSGATAELVIDSLPEDVVLADLGTRQLRNLARPEHVFELRLQDAHECVYGTTEEPWERPTLPTVLAGSGPFVGRDDELQRLLTTWQATLATGTRAVLIAGEPGVGKTRLAGEWCRRAYDDGAVVLYGRCDEDLGAPYQPFAEALRSLVPSLGAERLRGLRGVEALLPLIPRLTDALPDLSAPHHADPDTERYALFDAVVALLGITSAAAPVVLVLDDLHWAAKPTLLLLRHLLRFGEQARVQIIGTYRSTDLDRSHPLAAMLADLHRDGSAARLALAGLDEDEVTAYVAEAGYDDEELAQALASVTGGNPFFLIEALRHVDESGGHWDPSTLPQGVREAVSRRLSRLPAETNKALAAAAVVGSRFALTLVEGVVGDDLVDAFDEARKAGIVIEESAGMYRFNHALVRQSLLAELPSVRRMRLHQRIATTLEADPGADDELLAELAHHYFECAWAGNAAKAVEYCRRAADQAMTRLAYEGAADLYDMALHALDELDDELLDRDDRQAELLVARCEALLAAGDVLSAKGAVSELQEAARDSARLAAWGTCFDGQLSMLTDPERLDEIESAVAAAAETLAGLQDAAGEANAHTVRAGCLARLGRIADSETALDQALTAARRAGEHRRVNAVLAGAPLAALWGPNPVPRAGGRCLDVVRLLRITTGSPLVEATSTRCQGVLDAFRGRASAGRHLVESARRTLTELGMRHALLEVEQFAGIVELVADDPAAAEPHLRRAYEGFRRMRLDADTAETAALLARACHALDQDAEADELCRESERLAGHALKPSIAWRTVRAQLLAHSGSHDDARRVAQEAVALAERTDALIDHGDACLALATVRGAAGDTAGAQQAAQQALELYERKGAGALAKRARRLLEGSDIHITSAAPTEPTAEFRTPCVRAGDRVVDTIHREAWREFERLFSPACLVESRRKLVGFRQTDLSSDNWAQENRRALEKSGTRLAQRIITVRGDRLALARIVVSTTDASPGAPSDEFLMIYGIDDDGRIALQLWFDIDDLDAALAELDAAHARFERADRPALENAASQVDARLNALFAERRWDEIAALFTQDIRVEDRRTGVRRESTDRDSMLAEIRAIADVGVRFMTSEVVATRGDRLALLRTLYSGRAQPPVAYRTEILRITEINSDDLISAFVALDSDDFDAAFAELDARYAAGEAQPYADIWSTIAGTFVAHNRHEVAPTTPDLVSIDHRRVAAFAPGEGIDYIRAGWDLDQNVDVYIEAAHRVNDLGAVFTWTGRGTSQTGFDAEWRGVELMTIEGGHISRAEVFDEADLDAALARFDELSQSAHPLENAASQLYERIKAHFAAQDWNAIAEMLADDICSNDRRRVVNAGHRHGRDALVAELSAIAAVGVTDISTQVVATRGERLVLSRVQVTENVPTPEAFTGDSIDIIEIDPENRAVARIVFDSDDIDAAFAELDARYLAGDAAPHAQTWSVITRNYAAFNRREMPSMTAGRVRNHRRGASFQSGELATYIRSTRDFAPDTTVYIEAVHRLSDVGAVVTQVAKGSTDQNFEVEWREICVITVDGESIGECELYDDIDLAAALARYDELIRPTRRLQNAASRMYERFNEHLMARDWDAMTAMLTDDACSDDRRRVVGGGVQQGRDAQLADLREIVALGVKHHEFAVLATRGERLTLTRTRVSGGQEAESFGLEMLSVIELGADDRIAAGVLFDPDDIEAAFEELDARFLVGDAAPYARTWSTVTQAHIAVTQRHELPSTTPGWVNIDHRRGIGFAPGDMSAYIRDALDFGQRTSSFIETVHRLDSQNALLTMVIMGTSREGFGAEWRVVQLISVEGGCISRMECYDEDDLDAALTRFDELTRAAPQLRNAATGTWQRLIHAFNRRDITAFVALTTSDGRYEDRRKGLRDVLVGPARQKVIHAVFNTAPGDWRMEVEPVAIRGARLSLTRERYRDTAETDRPVAVELLRVMEVGHGDLMHDLITFDPDDIASALQELDHRYLAGEAADHSQIWSVIANAYAAFNRHEVSPLSDWKVVDTSPDATHYVECVHLLSDSGAVFTDATRRNSSDACHVERRVICFLASDGGHCELFDTTDLDLALARFDELTRRASQLNNAATQRRFLVADVLNRRDYDGLVALSAADGYYEDRRKVLRHEARGAELRRVAYGLNPLPPGWALTVTPLATRGSRVALTRDIFRDTTEPERPITAEHLTLTEVDHDGLVCRSVLFDGDDVDGAFAELESRYLAGEAGEYAQTWSAISQAQTTLSRRELPAMTPDCAIVDHRPLALIEAIDLTAYFAAGRDQEPEFGINIVDVHRLTPLGGVVTWAAQAAAKNGFDADRRLTSVVIVDHGLICRCELYDETDLDAAVARFDELSPPSALLENAASQLAERFQGSLAARDWDTIRETFAANFCLDDRRRTVNAGIRHGRDAEIEDLRAAVDVGFTDIAGVVLATRGQRLALVRVEWSGLDQHTEAVRNEWLGVVEIDADGKFAALVMLDLDRIDAAFEELDSRYLAGEAAAYSDMWSRITDSYAALNRHELPRTTPDWINIDHRRVTAFASGDLAPYIRAGWELGEEFRVDLEAVHRLTDLGAVVTTAARGISRTGFGAEWRQIALLTFDHNRLNRLEVFDEADIATALAQFDALNAPV